ncbi:MAG: RsmD family RNA methyltransferase [Bacteroidia bacterium]
MRIISGSKKGAVIRAPKNLPVRPTMDKNKESLFNILHNYFHFEEMDVLDLFAGTGNVSYEFASRGARSIVAVDSHPGCTKFISTQAKQLEFEMIEVLRNEVFRHLRNEYRSYDFVYADPPFSKFKPGQYQELAELIFERQVLKPEGWLVMEHPSNVSLSEVQHFHEERAFGQCIMSFFIMPEK